MLLHSESKKDTFFHFEGMNGPLAELHIVTAQEQSSIVARLPKGVLNPPLAHVGCSGYTVGFRVAPWKGFTCLNISVTQRLGILFIGLKRALSELPLQLKQQNACIKNEMINA